MGNRKNGENIPPKRPNDLFLYFLLIALSLILAFINEVNRSEVTTYSTIVILITMLIITFVLIYNRITELKK